MLLIAQTGRKPGSAFRCGRNDFEAESQHGLRSQNANRMLTLFRKICFDRKNPQSLVPTVKTPETPVKSRVSGVLKGAGKRSKCSKRHPLPRTRNQFGSNPTRVRIPPAAPARRKRHVACDELFHSTAKLIACSDLFYGPEWMHSMDPIHTQKSLETNWFQGILCFGRETARCFIGSKGWR